MTVQGGDLVADELLARPSARTLTCDDFHMMYPRCIHAEALAAWIDEHTEVRHDSSVATWALTRLVTASEADGAEKEKFYTFDLAVRDCANFIWLSWFTHKEKLYAYAYHYYSPFCRPF